MHKKAIILLSIFSIIVISFIVFVFSSATSLPLVCVCNDIADHISCTIDHSNFFSSPLVAIASTAGFLIIVLIFALFVVVLQKKSHTKLLNYDTLTGLLSEKCYYTTVETILTTAKSNEYISLSIDIDNFKNINNIYGYAEGTLAIKKFATHLKTVFGEQSTISRVNGDLFLLLVKNTDETLEKIQKVDHSLSLIDKNLSTTYIASISTGVYVIDEPALPVPHIIDCTNSARLKLKQYFESTVSEYTEEMKAERLSTASIIMSMEEALSAEQFFVLFQPKHDTQSLKIVGAEALVRWQKADGSTVYPDQFIPLFEKNGFVTKLDNYVFEKVCVFISENANEYNIPKLSVNMSIVTLLSENMEQKICDIQNKYGIKSSQIEFEITESAFAENFERVILEISHLKELGFSVSMDDFGSGHSSFNRLRDINVDVLKIDKECINSSGNEKGPLILKSIIDMSKILGLKTIVEGVETPMQLALLKELNCDALQGYLLSRPMLPSAFLLLL